tara:strand:- start:523 stop:786 length:264 start_codon:yes stop_codon:yes gene_type:complete
MSIKLACRIFCCPEEDEETKPNQPITKFNEVDGEQNLNMKGISTPAINKIRDNDKTVVENPMNNSNARGSASDDSSGGFESIDIAST